MSNEITDITKQKHLKFKEILAYSLGLFGFQAIVGLLFTYQAEFSGSILGANVIVVAILVLVAKIVSAAADPIVGNLVDRSQSKLGKFKSMIVYSLAPLLIATAIIFVKVPFKGVGLYVWIFIVSLIWSIAMTMGDVPSQGIAAALTPNPTERTNVVSISNTAKQIGFSACAVIVPIVCLIVPQGSQVIGFEGDQDTPMNATEFLFVGILTAVLGCVLFALIPLINKERVTNASSETVGFKEMFAALKSNKPFMLVIISYFLGFGRQMAMGIQVQAATIILGSQNLVVVLGIVTAIGSMISMAICPFLIKKLNEKKAYILLSVYGFAASIFSFIIGHFWFDNPKNMVLTVLFYASLFLIGLQFGAVTLMPMIMTADCVDAYEYETGKRNEGACYSILTLTIKVCLALGMAVGLVFVGASGYYEALSAQNFEACNKDVIFFAYTALPGILALLSIIPMLKYDIVGEKKAKISEALAARRTEN
jgi:Na+/melibiose symporter-like transporter